MADERIEMVRRFFEHYLAGERDEWMRLIDPDVELEVDAVALTSGSYKGRDALEQWANGWEEMWEDLTYEPEEFLDAGEMLVVGVRQRSRGPGSGVPVDQTVWWVLEFEGELVRRLRFFTEKQPALEAAGLSGD